jgi:hypothetical protein
LAAFFDESELGGNRKLRRGKSQEYFALFYRGYDFVRVQWVSENHRLEGKFLWLNVKFFRARLGIKKLLPLDFCRGRDQNAIFSLSRFALRLAGNIIIWLPRKTGLPEIPLDPLWETGGWRDFRGEF